MNVKIKNCHVAGIFFGYSLASRMIFTGVIFSLGVVVIQKWHYGQENVYLAINGCMRVWLVASRQKTYIYITS